MLLLLGQKFRRILAPPSSWRENRELETRLALTINCSLIFGGGGAGGGGGGGGGVGGVGGGGGGGGGVGVVVVVVMVMMMMKSPNNLIKNLQM
jgi:hypothetical protein